VSASDGVDIISKGLHERFVVDAKMFEKKLVEKSSRKVSS
jgi:predicted thioesterase